MSLTDIPIGTFVEVKVRDNRGLQYAREIDRAAKQARKVKGTISGVSRSSGRSVLAIDGLSISLTSDTDIIPANNGMFDELFGEMRSDDLIGDESGYHSIGDAVLFSGSLRSIARLEDSYSLAPGSDDLVGVGEPSARVEVLAMLPGGFRLFTQGQAIQQYQLYRSGESLAEDPTGDPKLRIRQLYLAAPSLFGLPVGFIAGKLRVRDNREFLFDEYLDGARLYVYPAGSLALEASVFTPVAPLKTRFETWRDLLVQLRWFPGQNWRGNVYSLMRFDEDIERNRDVRYYGASLEGKHDFLKMWGNGALLRGTDKGRPQEAYAYDVGVGLRARGLPFRPGVSVSYAVGSGDRDGSDQISGDFRQTGYDDNSSRVWGLASFSHFGEVLDPELNNLSILTATFGVRSRSRVSLDFAAHRYLLMEPSDELDHVGLDAPGTLLTGESLDVGYGADGILALRDVLPGMHLTYKVGVFLPGSAFSSAAGQAWSHKLELRIDP